MAKYIFGLEAERTGNNAVNSDYVVDYNPAVGNYNPYSKEKINEIICNTTRSERITSIPSPYARMHVTDLAFMELRQGQSLLSQNREVTDRDISPDYSRALSHCLDVYEMLYYSDEVDLQEKGITVTKINLKTPSPDYKNRGHLNEYLETLQLYRDQYMRTIRQRMRGHINENEFTFDFSSLYIFKYKGKTFAASSPFTGFFAKADCNLKDAGLSVKDAEGRNRLLFTNNPEDWRDIKGRTEEFRKFMYLLLNEKGTKLCYVFNNLFEVIKQCFSESERIDLDEKKFSDVEKYRKFNVGNDTLQKIGKYKNRDLYIRPDNIDCSYLKYLLFLAKPADLSIRKEEYKTAVEERSFDGNLTCWLGPNDILSDALFVLPYDVNGDYLSVPYLDESKDNQQKNRCLIPIKSSGLQLIPSIMSNLTSVKNDISIVKKAEDTFLVKMNVKLENGGQTVIRREYRASQVAYPYGKIVYEEETNPFAFGIYPFVKTTLFDNIYKVMFYHNDLKPIVIEDNNEKKEQPLLHFFSIHSDNGISQLEELPFSGDGAMVQCNQTVKKNDKLQGNCMYYHIEAERSAVDIVEVASTDGTALIVPLMRRVEREQGEGIIQLKNDEVIIAVDLGTSNTYAAYLTRKANRGDFGDIHEISTIHTDGKGHEWAELMFMHDKCSSKDAIEENRTDLYLQNEDGKYSNAWLATQLCEFAPSRIVPQGRKDGYAFPIPSVINQTFVNGAEPDGQEEKIPLFNSAIPFAYYKIGKRIGNYDHITDGKFKWLRMKDKNGNYVPITPRVTAFRSFVKELLFLFRSNLISLGYNPENTTLIWTYPLSFAEELRIQHERIWKEEFENCFNGREILYTNESMAPIYGCIENPNDVDRLTLLIDIGGGSTDVYGFKENHPVFSSSFSFAGNSLYLDGDLNHGETINKTNVMRKQIDTPECKAMLAAKSSIPGTEKINQGGKISSIMNYGFSQAPTVFGDLFQQNMDPKYMLKFHNAAIVYHVAQLCKIMSSNECPVNIYLTGNGSRLLSLNSDYMDYFHSVFKHFYGELFNEDDFDVVPQDNPKTATAIGALIGYRNNETGDPGLVFGVDEDIRQVVMLGDGNTKYEIKKGKNSVDVDVDNQKKEQVANNVREFVNLFYTELWPDADDCFKRTEVESFINVATTSKMMTTRGRLSESLFFQYISLMMENISAKMYKKYKD